MKQLTEVEMKQLDEQGYIIVENVLSKDECTHYKNLLRESYNQYKDQYALSEAAKKFHGTETAVIKVVYNLYNKHRDFFSTIDDDKVFPYVSYLLKKGSYMNQEPFILQLSSGRGVGHGSQQQQLHIDSNMPGTPFALVAQALWMLDDFTEENGATKLVPGSHLTPSFAENGKRYINEISACAPAGSVLIYNGGVWHGSGSNQSESERWALINTYSRWFLKPSFDPNKNMPVDMYESLTDRQKELLGYKYTPPKDEFTRLSRRSDIFEPPSDYSLPS